MRWMTLFVTWILVISFADSALALREFKKTFEKRYAEVLQDKAVKTTFRKAKCNLCHMKGKKKEFNNPYGDALSKFIEGDAEDRLKAAKENGTKKEELGKILAEVDAALAQVEGLESPDGLTFGQRIHGGQLPVELPPGDDEDEDEEDGDDEDEDEEEENEAQEESVSAAER